MFQCCQRTTFTVCVLGIKLQVRLAQRALLALSHFICPKRIILARMYLLYLIKITKLLISVEKSKETTIMSYKVLQNKQ